MPTPFAVTVDDLEGGVRVVGVRGELDLNTAPQLEQALEEALAEPGVSVLLDLGGCEFIDSTGIALIVRAWQRVEGDDAKPAVDGRLVLCSCNAQVQRLLDITGVATSIPTHPDRDSALADLRG